ncbi:MAG TPA: hypothetical protein VL856_10380, partial [Acidimicrobiia bacterium]|nr:hypothetical protein [Acidimicrobiia bacterium]
RGTPFAVVSINAVKKAGGVVEPNRVYLRGASSGEVRRAVKALAPDAQVSSRAAVVRALGASPLASSVRRGFRAAVVLAAVFAAVALALMALADVGPPVLRPERVLNVGSGSRPNHGGYGNALTTTTTTTTTTVPSSPLPPVRSGAVPRDNAEFAMVVRPDREQSGPKKSTSTTTTTTTVPKTPTTRKLDVGGPGTRGDHTARRPHRPHTPHVPSAPSDSPAPHTPHHPHQPHSPHEPSHGHDSAPPSPGDDDGDQHDAKPPKSDPDCKPGNGFGDTNHCHDGPPGQTKKH